MVAFWPVGPGLFWLPETSTISVRSIAVVAGLEPDEEVRGVAVAPTLVHVGDREAEVVVLHVRLHVPVQLELAREELLPGVAVLAVEGDVGDLGLLRRHGALAGLEVDVAGRADGVEAVDHRAQPLAAVADLADDRVPHRLGGEHLRLGDRHQVSEAIATGDDDLLVDPLAGTSRPAWGRARGACRRRC